MDASTKKLPAPFNASHITNENNCHAITGHGTQCQIKISSSRMPDEVRYTCKRHSNREDEIRTYMQIFKEKAKGRDYANKSGYDSIGGVPGRVNMRLNGRWYSLDTARLWVYDTNRPNERPIGRYIGQQVSHF